MPSENSKIDLILQKVSRVEDIIFGDGDNESLLIRLDRIEQRLERKDYLKKTLLGAFITVVTGSILYKLYH